MQVARVLARARSVTSSCRGAGFLCTSRLGLHLPGLQNHLRLVKTEQLHGPSLRRNLASATICPHALLRPLKIARWTAVGKGRAASGSGLIVGVALGTSYLSRKSLADIPHCGSEQQSPIELDGWDYRRSQIGRVIKRLWVPSLCVLTISLGWHYPVSLLVNLIFLMWSTKPSPSSIYMWVEERRQEDALKRRGLDRMKAQAAAVMHVEVRDNMLFCLARVSSLTSRSTLVGFLGDWWVIYSSSSAIDTGVNLRSFVPMIRPFTSEDFSIN